MEFLAQNKLERAKSRVKKLEAYVKMQDAKFLKAVEETAQTNEGIYVRTMTLVLLLKAERDGMARFERIVMTNTQESGYFR